VSAALWMGTYKKNGLCAAEQAKPCYDTAFAPGVQDTSLGRNVVS